MGWGGVGVGLFIKLKIRKCKLFKGFFAPYIKASEAIRSEITLGRDVCIHWQLEGPEY